MTTTLELLQLHIAARAEAQKPGDIHWRKECEGFRCGAHKSWLEGHAACASDLLSLLGTAIEALEYIRDRRNGKCQSEGCMCAYDTAHFALSTIRDSVGEGK